MLNYTPQQVDVKGNDLMRTSEADHLISKSPRKKQDISQIVSQKNFELEIKTPPMNEVKITDESKITNISSKSMVIKRKRTKGNQSSQTAAKTTSPPKKRQKVQ